MTRALPEDVPQHPRLLAEDKPDRVGLGYRAPYQGPLARPASTCPICLADHQAVAPRFTCPEHGHLLQPWRGRLECPGRCQYTAPEGGRE